MKGIGRPLLINLVGGGFGWSVRVGRFWASAPRMLFLNNAKTVWLISVSFLVLFASVWLILSPGVIYSRAMTWDLLFILEGAWRLYTGQVSHIDFHYPIGVLSFVLTVLGFFVIGLKPIAFLVGECFLAVVLTALSIVVVKDRLPALPGVLFVTMCALLVLAPITTGLVFVPVTSADMVTFTFAMSYNRFAWTAVSILCLLLFIEPRGRRDPVWADLAAGSILTIALFYFKITYFGVALGAISLALLASRAVRQHWPWWCGTLLLAVLVAFAPMNRAYRADIIFAMSSQLVHLNPLRLFIDFGFNVGEQIWLFAELLVLLFLFTQRRASPSDIVFGVFIWIFGFFLYTQNSQSYSIPLYVVVALILYVRLGNWFRSARHLPSMLVSCVMICTLLPLLTSWLSIALALVGYNIKATENSNMVVVTTKNLQGLAVPVDRDDVLDEVAAEPHDRDYFSRIRAWRVGFELSQQEYIKTILALADLLRDEEAALARVLVIDQVNPLPFVIGAPAPRGGNLWSGDIPWQPAEEALSDADYVAIPHFPTQRATLIGGLQVYKNYLSTHFVQQYETPYWTVLQRRNGIARHHAHQVPSTD